MKELINLISKKEWQFVVVMATIAIILTTLPYLFGYFMTPQDTVYNGLHALSPGDIPVYYSYINQIKEGDFLVKDLFTAEGQAIGTFNVWWFLVGIIAKIFSLSVMLAFQLSRILMIPVFVFFAYLFLTYFLSSEIQRKISLVFVLFASGSGFWVAGLVDLANFEKTATYWWPIDLWLTEAVTFNALYQTSHFIASITLMLVIFLLMLLAFEKNKFNYAVISGVLALFYFNFHPYYLPVIFGVLGLYLFVLFLQASKILWRQMGYLVTVFLISLPTVIYHFWLIQNVPVIGQRAIQNITTISPIIFVIIGYGFLLPGFLLGLYFLIKNKSFNNKFGFLIIWLVVNIVLIYSPFPFHSRYTQGIQIIFSIFTVVGLFYLLNYLKGKLKPKTFDFWFVNYFLFFLIFVVWFATSNLYSILRDGYYFYVQPPDAKNSLYLQVDVVRVIDWLADQPSGQIIFAADIPSKFIPGFSNQKVYLAHAHETLFFYAKASYLIWFWYDNDHDLAKAKFLTDRNIDYVLYSEYEKKLGLFDPTTKDYLKLVVDLPKAKLYQVINN